MRHDLVPALRPLAERLHTGYCWVKKAGLNPSRISEQLTEKKLAQHLNGSGKSYGATPIAPGTDTTRVAVLDLDSHKGETPWEAMQEVGIALMQGLEDVGISPIPFRSSGGNGIHLYMLWQEPQNAYSVRSLLSSVLGRISYSDGPGGVAKKEVEIFPKQDEVAADGYGSMFILPLSGKSCPLDLLELSDIDKEEALDIHWPESKAVPLVERPQKPSSATSDTVDLEELQSALDAIPNSGNDELSYDDWRNIIFGIHHATNGSDDGMRLADEFSARSSKHSTEFLFERVWPYARNERGSAITYRSVLAKAREYGWEEDMSDVFGVAELGPAEATRELPMFQRSKKGEILALMDNVAIGIRHPYVCAARIALDEFRDEIMYAEADANEFRPFRDTDYTVLRIRLGGIGFQPVSREMIRDAVHLVAHENRFDSAIDWIKALSHDGKARAERFFIDYCMVEDTPYARACGLYLWSALAGRCYVPGTKVDMVPVLIGGQGMRKSTGIAAIAPDNDYFKTISLSERDADLSRKMRRCLVAEIDEMRGLNTGDEEAIKSFITRTHEEWTPKYQEYETKFPRRLVMIGSTNKDELFSDDTGNRRYLPLTVQSRIDTDAIDRDRDQLWAEGLKLFLKYGVDYQKAEALAVAEHKKHMVQEPWEPLILDWLASSDMDDMTTHGAKPFTMSDVLSSAIGMPKGQQDRRAQMRAGKVLKAASYTNKQMRIGEGDNRKVWIRKEDNGDLV